MKSFFIKTNNLISWDCRYLYSYLYVLKKNKIEPDFNNLMIYLDLYDPRFNFENQCTGYKNIIQMLKMNVIPATEDEFNLFIKDPFKPVELKYLTFIHENLRYDIRKNWNLILKLYKIQNHD